MRLVVIDLAWLSSAASMAGDAVRETPLTPRPTDVLATGNEWVALPDIRASDGALTTFNALSMRDRGLLQASGEGGRPVLEPYFQIEAKKKQSFNDLAWTLLEYWIPQGHETTDGLELTITYCAPNGYRAAFIRLT